MEIAGRKITPSLLVGAGMLMAAVIGFAGINPHLPGGGDNAGYIAEAEAWLKLGHRANLHEAGEPLDGLKPPLFSLLLAGVEMIWGRSVVAMKGVLVLFSIGSVWAAWWALRAGLSSENVESEKTDLASAGIAFWFSLMPSLSLYTHDVLSDVPYTFLALVTAGFAFRALRSKHPALDAGGLAIALALATLMRTAGVILGASCCASLLVESAMQRKSANWRRVALHAGIAALITIAFLAHQSRNYVAYTGTSAPATLYSEESLFERIQRVSLFYFCFQPAEFAVYPGFSPVAAVYAMGAMMFGMFGIGAIELWRSGRRMIPVLFLSHQAALLLWPFLDARFFLPTLPLYLCVMLFGARALLQRFKFAPKFASALIYIVTLFPAVSIFGTLFFFGDDSIESSTFVEWGAGAVILAVFLSWASRSSANTGSVPNSRVMACATAAAAVFLANIFLRDVSENVVRERHRGPVAATAGWPEFYDAAIWLKSNSQPSDHVASSRASLVWFWSGLQGVRVSGNNLSDARWAIIDTIGEDQWSQRVLKPVIDKQSESWKPVWNKNGTVIFKRIDPTAI